MNVTDDRTWEVGGCSLAMTSLPIILFDDVNTSDYVMGSNVHLYAWRNSSAVMNLQVP
jgi:hypothetical protein